MTDPIPDVLVDLDPNVLAAHPANVRRNLGDLRSLTRSINAVGIVEPLIVVPTPDDGHRILAGHRRCAAAIQAGLAAVPCVVRADLADQEAAQVSGILVENTQRQSLSSTEEASGYEQLAVLGLSNTSIAKATGMTRKHVEKARRMAASEVATATADRYNLTLDQALVVAEFDDDTEAVKALVLAGATHPGQFDHVASRLRQDKEQQEQRAATTRALTEAGVTVLDDNQRYAHRNLASLRDLTDRDDGKALDPDTHAGCDGHVAIVEGHNPNDVRYYCLDPKTHGHRSRYGKRTTSTPMTDDDKTKRREVIENNKAWRAAEPVRHSYIQELLTRKKVPDGTLRYLVTEIITEPHRVGDADERLLAELLGVDDTGRSYPQAGPRYVTKLTDARLPFGLLVQVAADNEQTMGVHTWRHKNVRAARWLTYLQTVGYTLSDIEQHVVAAAAPTSTESDKTQAVGETAAEGAEIITLRKRSDAAVAPAQADDDIADTDDDIADTDETTSTATDADPVDVS